ncbi:39299_t:CDS:1, partial [Gigaspora margarita]
QMEQTNILKELLKKKRLFLELLEQKNEQVRNEKLFLEQKNKQIRNETLFLEQENKRIRNENLFIEQENERVRNENLLLKQENEQTRNNKIPKSINRINFTYTEHLNKTEKRRRILADSEIERLLKKLNSIDPILAST